MQVEMKIELPFAKEGYLTFTNDTDGYVSPDDMKRQIIDALEKVTDAIGDWQKFVVIIKTVD